jgi:hypothetical protein
MGAMKKLNSMRTIRNIGRVAGLLYISIDLCIVFIDIFAPLSRVYVPIAPSHAATVWVGMSAVLAALVGRVEMVGGIWMLLVTWSAVLAGRLPRALNSLGVVVGVAGVLTVVPALEGLGIGFRLGEIVWIVWLAIVMVRSSPSAAARTLRALFAVRFGKRVATTQDLTPTRGES